MKRGFILFEGVFRAKQVGADICLFGIREVLMVAKLEFACSAGSRQLERRHLAVGENQRCHFGIGAPPILVYFSGDWDVHWGYDLDVDPWPFRRPCQTIRCNSLV